METKEKETELVQLIRQLKDYVILDRKDYEKLVQNSNPQLGPGLAPDIFLDAIKDDSKNDEDSNRAK